jgi:hypothetical protein
MENLITGAKQVTRDEKGRFPKGVSGNPRGRKARAAEDEFIALIDKAVSNSDWIAIIEKTKQQALRGDAIARAWLADRKFGKAKERHEHAGENGEAIEVRLIQDE